MVPTHALAMASISPVVWITVIVILIIVFGAAKLPDIAKNLGKSAKVLKAELQDLSQDNPQVNPAPQATTPAESQNPEATGGAKPGNQSGQQLPPQDNQ